MILQIALQNSSRKKINVNGAIMKLLPLIFLLALITLAAAQDRQFPGRNQPLANKPQFQNPDGPPGVLSFYPRLVWNTNSLSIVSGAGKDEFSKNYLGFKLDVLFPLHRNFTLQVNWYHQPYKFNTPENIPSFNYNLRQIEFGFKVYLFD
jgi:hypothetical protein